MLSVPPIPSRLRHPSELADRRVLKGYAQMLYGRLEAPKEKLEVFGAFDFPGLLHEFYGGGCAHNDNRMRQDATPVNKELIA